MSEAFDFLRTQQLELEQKAGRTRLASVAAGVLGASLAVAAFRVGFSGSHDAFKEACFLGSISAYLEGTAVWGLHGASEESNRAAKYEAATLTPEFLPELMALKQPAPTQEAA